jgi:hypothetical protein
LLTLGELALVGFSPTHDVQPFEVADGVKTGSILFLHRSDGMLHHDPGEGATPIGVTTSDLAPHSVIRPPFLPSPGRSINHSKKNWRCSQAKPRGGSLVPDHRVLERLAPELKAGWMSLLAFA